MKQSNELFPEKYRAAIFTTPQFQPKCLFKFTLTFDFDKTEAKCCGQALALSINRNYIACSYNTEANIINSSEIYQTGAASGLSYFEFSTFSSEDGLIWDVLRMGLDEPIRVLRDTMMQIKQTKRKPLFL